MPGLCMTPVHAEPSRSRPASECAVHSLGRRPEVGNPTSTFFRADGSFLGDNFVGALSL
jgi:hypothetical protein